MSKPSRRRSRITPALVLAASVAICLAVVYFLLEARARAGRGMPDYSVYSDAPDGLAQAAGVLRKLGWQPVAVTRPIQQTRYKGLLILVEPHKAGVQLAREQPISDTDVDGLLDWVAQGNTLLLCCSRQTRLHDRLAVGVDEAGADEDDVLHARPGAVGEYTARVDGIGLESPATIGGRGMVPLWLVGGRPAAVLVRHGKGRVLVAADPSLLTHRGLLREDNVVFLYNLAALDAEDGRVYFDEYHHGIRSGGGYWNYLRYHHQHWVVVDLVLLACLALWAVGRRLGPAVPMPAPRRADGVDYAHSVARIYQKSDVRPLAAGVLARHFLDTLTRHLRLRRHAEPREILAAWRQRHTKASARELDDLLRLVQDWQDGEVGTADGMVADARALDAFVADHLASRQHAPQLASAGR
jgi:hypothetical protein